MKILVFALLFTIGAVSMAQDAGRITQAEFESATLGRAYQYNVYLPAGYDSSGVRYPVIYLLHGRGDSMAGWTSIKNSLDALIAAGSVPPMIAVMPDFPSSDRAGYYIDSQYTGSPAAEPVESAFFFDLIPHIESAYRAIPAREARLVGGYSMGGYGALRYSLAHPEIFAGALVLSPAVYIPFPPVDSSTREFGAFGLGAALFDDDTYTALNYPALLPSFGQTALGLSMFIAVGDDEYKNERPEDALHDLDVEAHMVFNQVARVPSIQSEFRVYDGGHDWDVWQRGFEEGLPYLARALRLDDGGDFDGIKPLDEISGGDGQAFAGGIAVAPDGSTVRAVTVQVFDTDELDVTLQKRAADGTILWSTQIGTHSDERSYGVALDAQDNVIVAGYTTGDLDHNHPEAASDDAFVTKNGAEGTPHWTIQFGDSVEADRIYGLTVSPDGNIYVTGYTKGVIGGDHIGDKDIFVAQISPAGEIVWIDQFGGPGEDKGYTIAVSGDTLYVGGVFVTDTGGLDAHLTAYSTSGEYLWTKAFGTPEWDEAHGIAVAPDGTIYVTGFVSGDFDGHEFLGDHDAFVAAFDAEGTLLWSDQPGSPANDKGANVVVTGSGEIIVSAFSDGGIETTLGGFDIILLRYDSAGNLTGAGQLGTEADDGADEYAEKNLYMTLSGNSLLLSGLTGADVFITTVNLDE